MNKAFVLLVVLLISIQAIGQELTQTVRGTVTDKNSEQPLPGVNVFIPGSNPVVGTITDENGAFSFEKIPVGRVNLSFSFLGYKQADVQNVIVKSGKEVVLNIQMEEEIISTAEVEVRAFRKDQPVNEMAAISARSFTVEETEKYAGSWGDPSRMAMNYAGVTPAGDQVNDIVIRGNSPNGLLWRMEGINIPNPNHFGALGSTGGPVSMLNNNVLDNSDFYTGAFPAEFGNAVSGVFDLNLRTGNNQKREYLAQVGFNGFEIGVEGPFHKSSRASYLANYRYSTMGVIEALGVDMGIGAVPYYQDLVFNIDIPGVKYGKLSFFGLGGLSNIHFNYDSGDTTMGGTDFTSDMGVAGLSYTYYLSDKSRIKTSLAVSGTRTTTKDSLLKLNEIKSMYGDNSTEVKYSAVIDWKKKFNARNTLIAGVSYDHFVVNYADSFYLNEYNMYVHTLDVTGEQGLLQSCLQLKHRFTDKLTAYAGVHHQYSTTNEEHSVEPRASLKWDFAKGQSVNLGYGLHSQVQPRLILFTDILTDTLNRVYSKMNRDLDFTKSHHLVLGYDFLFTGHARFRAETYYQSIFNVPVENIPSYISVLNYGSSYGFMRYENQLVNSGTGYNSGIEITLERFLHKNYYFLTTVSVFNSMYEGSDKVERNTSFNGNYVANILGGYEFIIKEKNSISIDIKGVYAGGLPTLPIDLEASRDEGVTVFDYDHAYEKRAEDYYRFDLRISFRRNHRKFSEEIGLDITNLTGHKNHFMEYYNADTGEIEEVSRMGTIPMMMYRVNF